MVNYLKNKDEFLRLVIDNIHRDGINELINYLANESDFFESPASTQYHGSYVGGLCEHSLNVYYSLIEELSFIFGKNWEKRYSKESVAIVSLFHDLCKIGRYKKSYKNVKNTETGIWEQKETFVYDDTYFCMGHASLSLHRIKQFINLSDEEAQAIYWHMGAFDISQYSDTKSLCNAYKKNTLAFALHRADEVATFICENQYFDPINEED
jgi:hypothetical protein